MIQRPPRTPPFPYTTLFRSLVRPGTRLEHAHDQPQQPAAERRAEQRREQVQPDRQRDQEADQRTADAAQDRKSTRLNSSHSQISYAVFCLTKQTVRSDPG